MSQGMISNYRLGDKVMIDMYDIYSIAIEFKTPPKEVKSWSIEDIEWSKTIMTVQANIVKNKGK